jgi:hypothetical protein
MSREKPEQQALPITVIVCRRGQRSRGGAPCSVPGCGETHTHLCDYPLKGKKEGQTCDAKLCESHATRLGPGKDYCPAHTKFAARSDTP